MNSPAIAMQTYTQSKSLWRQTRSVRLAALAMLLPILPMGATHAANATVTWNFSPAPAAVSIVAGESVTWSGSFASHPMRQTDATFTAGGTNQAVSGTTFTKSFATAGTYYFVCNSHGSMQTTVTVTAACVPPTTVAALDIDGNGVVEATTDGLLVLRYLLGLRGSALTIGAIGTCPGRADPVEIKNYLDSKIVP